MPLGIVPGTVPDLHRSADQAMPVFIHAPTIERDWPLATEIFDQIPIACGVGHPVALSVGAAEREVDGAVDFLVEAVDAEVQPDAKLADAARGGEE
jgi:hypothetical protein